MKIKAKVLRLVLIGIILFVISNMVIDNLLYMNPIIRQVFEEYANHPAMKSMDYFGGMSNWLLINTGFSILFLAFLIILYKFLYNILPGKGLVKGLSYGIFICLIKIIPEAFNQYMLLNYPTILILIQMLLNSISIIIFGLLLSFLFNKFKIITDK